MWIFSCMWSLPTSSNSLLIGSSISTRSLRCVRVCSSTSSYPLLIGSSISTQATRTRGPQAGGLVAIPYSLGLAFLLCLKPRDGWKSGWYSNPLLVGSSISTRGGCIAVIMPTSPSRCGGRASSNPLLIGSSNLWC